MPRGQQSHEPVDECEQRVSRRHRLELDARVVFVTEAAVVLVEAVLLRRLTVKIGQNRL